MSAILMTVFKKMNTVRKTAAAVFFIHMGGMNLSMEFKIEMYCNNKQDR